MPEPHRVTNGLPREAALTTSGITELLDVMWERARESDPATAAPASASQLRLMYVVDGEEGIRMRTVGRRLGAAPPSVSRLCDRLQAAGFLERLPCPGSRREVTLRLTLTGKAHLQRVREQREDILHRAVQGMPQADRSALARGLAALHVQLAQSTDPVGGPGAVSAA